MTQDSATQLWPPEAFATERLRAQSAQASDAEEAWQTYAADPEVTRYLSWKTHVAPDTVADFFRSLEPVRAAGGDGHYAWVLRQQTDQQLIGSIGIVRDGGKVACGYVIGRRYWNRGYATEALRAVINWTWQEPTVQRVWAYCDTENPASARVMDKVGLQWEGVLRRWHVCPNLGNELRDCIVCAQVR